MQRSTGWRSISCPSSWGEALLALWFGTVRGRLAFAAERGVGGMIGMALYVYAVALHPLIALVAGDLFRLQKLLASRQIRPPSRRSVSYRSRPAALGLYRS